MRFGMSVKTWLIQCYHAHGEQASIGSIVLFWGSAQSGSLGEPSRQRASGVARAIVGIGSANRPSSRALYGLWKL